MSRYFMINSWVGSHENEPDYNGHQCGERNVRSSEVAPLYDQYGNANIKAFSDEALQKKAQAKPKLSAFDKVCTADRSYEKLCTLSEELDQQLDSKQISWEDYIYARKQLDVKLERQWKVVCKARGWPSEGTPVQPHSFDLTLDIEAPKQLKIDRQINFAIIPCDSVFYSLKDDNLFKIGFSICLTGMNKLSKLWNVGKQIIQEGVI